MSKHFVPVILIGILVGAGCPPFRYIALFSNHQEAVSLLTSGSVIGMNGERQIGALPTVATLRLYNNLGTPDSHLEVCNNPTTTTCACNPTTGAGYVRVDANPVLTQSIIRNNYIVYRPAFSEFVIRTKPASWEPGTETTQFPVYALTLFANPGAGGGAIHTFRLRAWPVGCPEDVPSLRIVNGAGAEVYRVESVGRVVYVRQGNYEEIYNNPVVGVDPFSPTIPPTINGIPMGFSPPGPIITGAGPVEVTVSKELATLHAEFWQSIAPFQPPPGVPFPQYESGPVFVIPERVRKNPDGTFTYTLSTPALQKGVAPINTMFVISLNIEENKWGLNQLIPTRYQAITQDMAGNLLCDMRDLVGDVRIVLPSGACLNCRWRVWTGTVFPGGPVDIGGCYLGTLTGHYDQFVKVLPYFFQFDPPVTGTPPPPPPPGNPPTVAQVEIKPEVFHTNTEIFTAFISFEDDERLNGAGADIATCNCNGAEAVRIINDADEHHYSICKFNRSDIIYDLGTVFVCTGTTTTGIEWRGTDEIEKIIDD